MVASVPAASTTKTAGTANGRGFATTMEETSTRASQQDAAERDATNPVSTAANLLLGGKGPATAKAGYQSAAGWQPAPRKQPVKQSKEQPTQEAGNDTATVPAPVPVQLPLPPPPPVELVMAALPAEAPLKTEPVNPPPASNATVAASGPAPAAKPEMAFAARVQPARNASETTAHSHNEPQASAAAASNLKKASAPDENAETNAPATQTINTAAGVYQANARAAEPTASPAPVKDATPVAEAATAAPAPAAHPATPLRDISLHLTQPGAEKVEVRVVQEAGEVRVAVRTADSDLASGLRQGVHDLVGKLEDNGYHAETWRPNAVSGPANSAASAIGQTDNHGASFQFQHGQSQEQSQNGQSQQQWGGSQGRQNAPQQDGGQRNQNSSNRPQWVEELESSVQGNGDSTGERNGNGS